MYDVYLRARGASDDEEHCLILPDRSRQFLIDLLVQVRDLMEAEGAATEEEEGKPEVGRAIGELFYVDKVVWKPPDNLMKGFAADLPERQEEKKEEQMDEGEEEEEEEEDGDSDGEKDEVDLPSSGGDEDPGSGAPPPPPGGKARRSRAVKIEKVKNLSDYPLPSRKDCVCSVCSRQFPSGVFLRPGLPGVLVTENVPDSVLTHGAKNKK